MLLLPVVVIICCCYHLLLLSPVVQIGLGWQSLHLIYHGHGSTGEHLERSLKEYIILTGSEAVSRSITDSIRNSAAACPDFMRSIPLNKDDEVRVEAIEKELIKLGSEVRGWGGD